MGRKREFDTEAVLAAARSVFVHTGYHATSVDDLLRATGIGRASLYQAFGSKLGLFRAVLQRSVDGASANGTSSPTDASPDIELLLVALMDLSREDGGIRGLVHHAIAGLGPGSAATLGRALMNRGAVDAPQKGNSHEYRDHRGQRADC